MPIADVTDGDRPAATQVEPACDAGLDPYLDAICRTTSHALRVPIAIVARIDTSGVRRAGAKVGRPTTPGDQSRAPRVGKALVVTDMAADPRFAADPMVTGEPRARFYAAVTLALPDGSALGTLCIIDTLPRPDFAAEEARILEDLALIVQGHLTQEHMQRRAAVLAEAAETARHRAETRLFDERRKVAERDARIAEVQELQKAAEHAADVGYWRIDAADHSVYGSPGIVRIFGRTPPDDVVGFEDHLSAYHPEDREDVRRHVEDALRTSAIDYEHRSRLVRPDGEVRIIKARGGVQRDRAGRVAALVGVCIDLTDVARSEEQMREATALLRDTLESMDQGLLMVRADGRICVHNRRVLDLLDLPDALMAREPAFPDLCRYLIDRGEDPTFSSPGGLRTEIAPWRHRSTHEHARPDGRILEITATPLEDGGVVLTYTDVTERKRAERRIVESEERYRLFADCLPQMVWIRRVDDGAATYTNGVFQDFYGPIGPSLAERIARYHPDDAARMLAERNAALSAGSPSQVIGRLRRHDGVYRWHKTIMIPMQRGGEVFEWLGTALDIDDLMTARHALEEKTRLLALAQRAAGAGLWEWNMGRDTFWISSVGANMLGIELGPDDETGIALPRACVHDAVVVGDLGDLNTIIRQAIETRVPVHLEFRTRSPNAGARWVQSFGQIVFDPITDLPTGMVGLHLDITTRKETERRIEHDAHHDALTGLSNRTVFRSILDRKLAKVGDESGGLAVMCLDLDRFKRVNDTLGHPTGDALLAAVAARLRANLREGDFIARLGGDEFAIVQDAGDAATAQAQADRLIAVMGEPFHLEGHALEIGLSIGVALAPAHGLDPDDLFKNADLALYCAKGEGRNTVRFYAPEMSAVARDRQSLETDLRRAFTEGGFELHYQPVLSALDREVVSFEALIRWNHPARGWVSPGTFIPFAEEIGLILPLGDWVLRTACSEAAAWPAHIRLAVNVSAIQVRQGRLVETVISALAASGLPASRLELEITETALMQDSAMVLETLHLLRSLGVTVALDDFGTGYSSLSYLRIFPFDRIKIDRSFIATIDGPQTAEIVRAIVGLSISLGMQITAEGVETETQFGAVLKQGCTEVQGFLFSPALPGPRAADLIRKHASVMAA